MAKVVFVGLDGTERSFRLQSHRPLTVGRDPGNDIVLRDPKVSRHHAEIIFERGFFVLRDLASANGCYVNGKRVRVAPLTHGARIRLGNTSGSFAEEVPTANEEVVAAPVLGDATAAALPTEDLAELDPVVDSPPLSPLITLPQGPFDDVIKKKSFLRRVMSSRR